MNKKEKFKNFLESLKGKGQDSLIESVKTGFLACFESFTDTAEDDVVKYFRGKIPNDIKKLIRQAKYSLYYGPDVPDEDWPGWSTATEKISEWMNNNLEDVYYDVQSGNVQTSEPQPEVDEETGETYDIYPEDWYHYESNDVKKLLLGELASYV